MHTHDFSLYFLIPSLSNPVRTEIHEVRGCIYRHKYVGFFVYPSFSIWFVRSLSLSLSRVRARTIKSTYVRAHVDAFGDSGNVKSRQFNPFFAVFMPYPAKKYVGSLWSGRGRGWIFKKIMDDVSMKRVGDIFWELCWCNSLEWLRMIVK